MNKNLFIVGIIAAIAIGFIGGYFIAQPKQELIEYAPLGVANPSTTVISYYSSLNKQVLWDTLNSMLMDINRARAPLASLAVASSSVSWGTLDNTDSASSSIINVPGGGTIGDLCLVETLTGASSTAAFRCEITATGTSNASATIYATVSSSTGISAAVGTLTTRLWILPVSSFIAPASVLTSTSTSY